MPSALLLLCLQDTIWIGATTTTTRGQASPSYGRPGCYSPSEHKTRMRLVSVPITKFTCSHRRQRAIGKPPPFIDCVCVCVCVVVWLLLPRCHLGNFPSTKKKNTHTHRHATILHAGGSCSMRGSPVLFPAVIWNYLTRQRWHWHDNAPSARRIGCVVVVVVGGGCCCRRNYACCCSWLLLC